MERKQLKSILSTANAGDQLVVNYGDGTSQNLVVTERKVWKGKGGSILLNCLNPSDGNKLVRIGSFSADTVVNVSLNGAPEVGLSTGTKLQKVFKTNAAKSVALKAKFLEIEVGSTVSVESAQEPSIEGSFKVAGVRKTPGRCGPVVLDLVNIATNEKSVLSAVRHSEVIDRVIVTSTGPELVLHEGASEDSV